MCSEKLNDHLTSLFFTKIYFTHLLSQTLNVKCIQLLSRNEFQAFRLGDGADTEEHSGQSLNPLSLKTAEISDMAHLEHCDM